MSEPGDDDVELGLCHRCEKNLRLKDEDYCQDCLDWHGETQYERQQEEGFRGTESASALAEEQARVQRELK